MNARSLRKRCSGQAGLSIVEVVIATALLSILGVGFLTTISGAVVTTSQLSQKTGALNLARSQMEDVKAQPFVEPPDYASIAVPPEYSMTVNASSLVADSLQEITVTVTRGTTTVQLTGYKANLSP